MGFKILTILFLVHSATCVNDYFWRDYDPSNDNQLPLDALVGGQDINQQNVFIGQVHIWPFGGVHPATIAPGKEVWAAVPAPKRATNFIQILCTEHPDRFMWVPATSQNLHLTGINAHIVRGGSDINHIIHIGRVKHEGNVVIGQVNTRLINNAYMVFVFNKRKYIVRSYEVLTYNN